MSTEEQEPRSPVPGQRLRRTSISRLLRALRKDGRRAYVLLPMALFVLLMAATLMLWQVGNWREEQRILSETQIVQSQVAYRFENLLSSRFHPLRRLRAELLSGRLAPEDFAAAARTFRLEVPSVEQIFWIGPDGTANIIDPPPAAPAGELQEHPAVQYLEESRLHQGGLLGRIEGDGYSVTVLLLVPVQDRTNSDDFAGVLGARVQLGSIIREVTAPETLWDFTIELRDEQNRFFQYGGTQHTMRTRLAGTPVDVQNVAWHLHLTPTPRFLASRWSVLPEVALIGGTLGSILLSGVVLQTLRHRWWETRHQRAYASAIESLTQIATGISGNLGGGQEVLDQLAESARGLLAMDMSVVALVDDAADRFEPLAASGLPAALGAIPLSQLPVCQEVIRQGNVIPITDTETFDRPMNHRLLDRLGGRSALMIPLSVADRTIGLLALIDREPRSFGESDLRLARLLGSQAAVILANHRLYEQMHSAIETQQRLIHQREALFSANAAIYQAGSLQEAFHRIVEQAPAVLGIDLCGVVLTTDSQDECLIAAVSRPFEHLAGDRVRITNRRPEQAFATRQPFVIVDARNDPTINPTWEKIPGIGSIAGMPMFHSDGRPLGLLLLVRHSAGAFSEEQLGLARMFAIRAAAAIETAELHQQTRRDAETKAMLLRELNHRVKNSLAGIAGLLSMEDPEMPVETRQWLDRVIERIRTMARAHELFSDGIERVSLSELVAQVLPSLAVVKPPEVDIQMDLGAEDVYLRTDRAVSLAMVLYELCYNAIVHGVGRKGKVMIRARHGGQGRYVVIEVVDDGRGQEKACRNNGSPEGTAGLGLKLVNGLATRELHGTFSLRNRRDGGTIATVQFPLNGTGAQEIV